MRANDSTVEAFKAGNSGGLAASIDCSKARLHHLPTPLRPHCLLRQRHRGIAPPLEQEAPTVTEDSCPLAIVGAGPAGLTAAIAAAQRGLKATVFERADVIARVGGGIVVHSNGLRVLDRLGLLDSFKPMMLPCSTLTLQLSDGHELVTDYSALPIPYNYFAVVLRHQLHTFLLAAAEKIATIRSVVTAPRSKSCQIMSGSDSILPNQSSAVSRSARTAFIQQYARRCCPLPRRPGQLATRTCAASANARAT